MYANLDRLIQIAAEKRGSCAGKYYIPKSWNTIGYEKYREEKTRPNEILVNPYDFFVEYAGNLRHESMREKSCTGSFIYGVLARSFTAWRHGEDDKITPGTFFKTITQLLRLKQNGVGLLYLLPVFESSSHYKKGGLGSPYAVRDIYSLDRSLHDELIGEYSPEILTVEFKALIESCHMLGIKVILDFVFRTVARDNVLISAHPDWFYWINKDMAGNFHPPKLGDGEKTFKLNLNTLKMLYDSKDAEKYCSAFSFPPDRIDGAAWTGILSHGGPDVLSEVENSYGITTVPGFSDVINDEQPAWTDVTYLKLYFDAPPEISGRFPENSPPFIMQDGASLSKFHGNNENSGLFDYLAGVIPFYIKNYGIDGARIDMAHALPDKLNRKIVAKIHDADSGFILWSEDLDPAAGSKAKAEGYRLISGFSYYDYKHADSACFNRNILCGGFLKSDLPVTASLETPDTPRFAYIHKNVRLRNLLAILNAFMPNSATYFNAGQELSEIQPMNLGLDNNESGRYVLDKNDPEYGKLAFFDSTCLHWAASDKCAGLIDKRLLGILNKNRRLLSNKKYFMLIPRLLKNSKLTVLCYFDVASGRGITVAANRSVTENARFSPEKHLPTQLLNRKGVIVYNNTGNTATEYTGGSFILPPCEAVIIEYGNKPGR